MAKCYTNAPCCTQGTIAAVSPGTAARWGCQSAGRTTRRAPVAVRPTWRRTAAPCPSSCADAAARAAQMSGGAAGCEGMLVVHQSPRALCSCSCRMMAEHHRPLRGVHQLSSLRYFSAAAPAHLCTLPAGLHDIRWNQPPRQQQQACTRSRSMTHSKREHTAHNKNRVRVFRV